MIIIVTFVVMLGVVLAIAAIAFGAIETFIIAGKIDQCYGSTAAVVFTIVATTVRLTAIVLLLQLPTILQI